MTNSDRDPDAIDRIRDDALTEQKPNLHNEIMNIPVVLRDMLKTTAATDLDSVQVYKRGHRDARHAAAEIANEADARIAELEAESRGHFDASQTYLSRLSEYQILATKRGQRIATLEAQLAAATERERRINQRAEILFDGIQGAHDMVTRWLADPSAPATDKIIELAGLLETRMDVTGRNATALAAAQPASDGQEGK